MVVWRAIFVIFVLGNAVSMCVSLRLWLFTLKLLSALFFIRLVLSLLYLSQLCSVTAMLCHRYAMSPLCSVTALSPLCSFTATHVYSLGLLGTSWGNVAYMFSWACIGRVLVIQVCHSYGGNRGPHLQWTGAHIYCGSRDPQLRWK